MTRSLLPVPPDVAARLDGRPLLLLLDVDGTLAPIVSRPDEAAVPEPTRRVVAALAARPAVHVALVSGRGAADAARVAGVPGVWVIGNHGFELESPDGEVHRDPRLAGVPDTVAEAARRLAPRIVRWPGVLLEDKHWTLSVHHRLADPAILPELSAAAEDVARATGLRITTGKKVIELRPAIAIDKGSAVLALGERLHALSGHAAALFIGDDATDEDAFRALRARSARTVTVRVTHGDDVETAAELAVRDPEAVREFLEWLLERSRD